MNLADPSLELIDPTPNVHGLFVQFDKTFFWTKLESVIVKWSKRMYSCAGTCTYHPRTRGCIITLSEPLLKLRPRKDLVETLLHEMIHAYLFITGGDRDRDGHGPMFKSHMHRINQKTNLNISIYHDFHDEVKLYKTHWWRCSGPCQQRQPFFGIIKRTSNRAPGPNDFWWEDHRRTCNGTFIKIKEPEKKTKGKESKKVTRMPINDISKYLINSSNTLSNVPSTQRKTSSNIKTISNINNSSIGNKTKSNGTATIVVTSNNNKINTIKGTDENKNIVLWKGDGYKINESNKTNSLKNKSVSDIVKNVWANKQINSNNITVNKSNNNKRRITDITQQSPPSKITKIDDYFNKSITSRPLIALDTATTILQDIYGQDFKLYQNEETNSKIIAVQNSNSNIVDCPICKATVKNCDINRHLDECLNKKEIKKITNIEIDLNDTFGILKSDSYKKNDVKEPKPSTSREVIEIKTECVIDLTESNVKLKCPCCNEIVTKSIDEHLDECLSIMNDQSTVPDERNSIRPEEITSDDDDYETVDESSTFNETGTKFPCPCCLNMVEQDEMNSHLDRCLKSN